MTKVISFISKKEGTGKTTNAINLCTTLLKNKKKVILIETDTRYDLISKRKMEIFKYGLDESKLFPIKASQESTVSKDIQAIKKTGVYDYILIDGSKKTTLNNIILLSEASDIVIITSNLTKESLLSAYQITEILNPTQLIKPNLKIVTLLNKIDKNIKIRAIQNTLAELNLDTFDKYVSKKKVFTTLNTFKAYNQYKPMFKLIIKTINNH